jgi:serine/threonine-protein kinase RsbW
MPTATPTRQPPMAAPATDAGTAGLLVSGLAIPGRPEHVQAARQFTSLVLRAHGRDDDTACLLVSELVTNSLQHSHSAKPGGAVTILVAIRPGDILIGVTDDGGPGEPVLHAAGEDEDDAESGRGLHLVDRLSAHWGHYRQGHQLTTWFTLRTGQPA